MGTTRRIAWMAAVALLAGAGTAQAATRVEHRFGGADARVDRAAEIKALVQSISSRADAKAKLAALTPAERRKVIAKGMTPAYSVREVHVITARAAAAAATRERYATFVCKRYSSVGVHVFNYVQDWWWDYTGSKVVDGGHHESSNYTAPFVNYVSSQYLDPVGGKGSWYLGRQTQGTFRISVSEGGYSVGQSLYQRMTGIVYGDGTAGWQCS